MTTDKIAHPPEPRVETAVQVMFFDTDCAGVVHNIAYLRFIEIARTHLAEQLGMSLAEMAESAIYPVVARTEIDYRRPARLGDRLIVQGWLESAERMRFWCAFSVKRPIDGALIAESKQMLAVVKMPSGKPVPVPEEWERRYPSAWKGRPRKQPVRVGAGE